MPKTRGSHDHIMVKDSKGVKDVVVTGKSDHGQSPKGVVATGESAHGQRLKGDVATGESDHGQRLWGVVATGEFDSPLLPSLATKL